MLYNILIFNLKKQKKPSFTDGFVRMKGLEPPRLSTLDPKSSAATNYATSAIKRFTKVLFFLTQKIINLYNVKIREMRFFLFVGIIINPQ